MNQLVGKQVLVTGAGNGIGRDLSVAFAKTGARICVTDINDDAPAETVEIIKTNGGEAISESLDVTDPENVREVRDRLLESFGPLDILINNAGILRAGGFETVSLEDHLEVFEVNALGPMVLTHAFLTDLISRRESYVVNIVDAAAIIGLPKASSYAASKSAMLSLGDCLRAELYDAGHRHVRVLSVCPGIVNTDMFHGAIAPKMTEVLDRRKLAKQVVDSVRRGSVALPKIGGQ
ncbi:MAG: short-chain dehydrogenase [Planctomycetaceae bacterium]|nr:short-chain dehydrogenase [Planctomycetaceae bacterium]